MPFLLGGLYSSNTILNLLMGAAPNTDGLNEAENRRQEQYGEERIIQFMNSHASQSTRDIIEALKADTDQFRDGAEQNDDLTMMCIRVN